MIGLCLDRASTEMPPVPHHCVSLSGGKIPLLHEMDLGLKMCWNGEANLIVPVSEMPNVAKFGLQVLKLHSMILLIDFLDFSLATLCFWN